MGNYTDLHFKIEKDDDWEGWVKKIPYIPFKEGWEIKVIPPFGGLQARFWVRLKGEENRGVSVYLDCYDRAGYYPGPYWEVYPFEDDVGRCSIDDIDRLVMMIESSLRSNLWDDDD